MATFVLVHGAHAGGWWWSDVRRYLRGAGHEVFTPSLTGHGEHAHLPSPDVTLETHILDVVNLLCYEELWNVVLVGWSYGGMVVAGAADRVPERLAHLVFGDALVPRDGDTAIDLVGEELRARMLRLAAAGASSIPLDGMADARLVPHPLATWLQPVRLTGGAAALPRTFIHCTSPQHHAIAASVERVLSEAGWNFREVSAGHSAPRENPRGIADMLLATVDPRSSGDEA